jgi:hypothetical protein
MAFQGQWLGDWPGDWYGADGAAPTQAATRSLLAFWMGGAVTGSAPTEQGGFRSLLAPWIGGASAPSGTEPPATAAPRSLLGFWAGGYAAGPDVQPPQPAPEQLSGGWFDFPDDGPRRRRLRDEQEARDNAVSNEQQAVSFALGDKPGANALRQLLRSTRGLTQDGKSAIDAATDDELPMLLALLMAMDD